MTRPAIRAAVAPEVECVNVPARQHCRDQRQKIYSAAQNAVQKQERRPGERAGGHAQRVGREFERAFREHDIFALLALPSAHWRTPLI